MAVINVVYLETVEDPQDSYEAIELSFGDNKKERFDSRDFVKDWYEMMKYISQSGINEKESISFSSSVDHFIMDGDKYDSAYLYIIENKPILQYSDEKIEGLEFFVHKGTKPTWDELKEYSKNKKVNA